MLLLSGCTKEPKERIAPITPASTLIKILKGDYLSVVEHCPSVDSGLVEIQCTLSHPITQVASADEIEIASLREIYYYWCPIKFTNERVPYRITLIQRIHT